MNPRLAALRTADARDACGDPDGDRCFALELNAILCGYVGRIEHPSYRKPPPVTGSHAYDLHRLIFHLGNHYD